MTAWHTLKDHINLVSYLPKNLPGCSLYPIIIHQIPWDPHGRHGMVAMAYSWGGAYDHVLPATSVATSKSRCWTVGRDFTSENWDWTQTWAKTPTKKGWYHGMLKIYPHLVDSICILQLIIDEDIMEYISMDSDSMTAINHWWGYHGIYVYGLRLYDCN